MDQPIIDIYDNNGSVGRYKRFSVRLPEFLAHYPPEKGYRIEAEMTDSLSLQTSRVELLREAIRAGRKPQDLGLRAVYETVVMVYIRRLVSPQGQVIATASAAKPIVAYKDYEILETAALQRLLALLGFGGEVFDADEAADMTDQDLRTSPTPATVKPLVNPSSPEPRTDKTSPGITTQTARDTVAQLNQEANTPVPPPQGSTQAVPPAMRRQVENLARQLGVHIPVISNFEDAKKAFKDLSGQRRAQRSQPLAKG